MVKMIESDEQTVSGIVLPDTAREKPQTAEVVAVGDSDEVKVEGEEQLIVDADDVRPVRADGPTRSVAGRSPPPGGADARRLGGARQDPTGPPRPRCGGPAREGSAGDHPRLRPHGLARTAGAFRGDPGRLPRRTGTPLMRADTRFEVEPTEGRHVDDLRGFRTLGPRSCGGTVRLAVQVYLPRPIHPIARKDRSRDCALRRFSKGSAPPGVCFLSGLSGGRHGRRSAQRQPALGGQYHRRVRGLGPPEMRRRPLLYRLLYGPRLYHQLAGVRELV